jgi:hypothetical protein
MVCILDLINIPVFLARMLQWAVTYQDIGVRIALRHMVGMLQVLRVGSSQI